MKPYQQDTMRIFVITVFIAITNVAIGQVVLLSKFKEIPLPIKESKELYQLNNSGSDFKVAIVEGELHISKYKYTAVSELRIAEGTLLGINYGEWGGGLFYQPVDTTKSNFFVDGKAAPIMNDPFRMGLMIRENDPVKKVINGSIQLKNGNIHSLFRYRDSVYTVEGLAHMVTSEGAINKLDYNDGKFTISRKIDLGDAPMAVGESKRGIVIATLNHFYLVNNWKKEAVFKDLFWCLLYPNSVVEADDDILFLGMRGGYSMINLKEGSIKFFQYMN